MSLAIPIKVTDAAFQRLAKANAGGAPRKMLRVAVLGGGCSGFQYSFEFADAAEEEDLTIEKDGQTVLVDQTSAPFLSGAVIDFKDELIGAHFTVENPNAASSCGCGTSFSI